MTAKCSGDTVLDTDFDAVEKAFDELFVLFGRQLKDPLRDQLIDSFRPEIGERVATHPHPQSCIAYGCPVGGACYSPRMAS